MLGVGLGNVFAKLATAPSYYLFGVLINVDRRYSFLLAVGMNIMAGMVCLSLPFETAGMALDSFAN